MQYDSRQDMDRTKSSGAMVWNTSPYVLVETEELVLHGQNFMMKEFLRCTLWSLWWLNLGALLVHTPDNCYFSPRRILHLIFFSMDNFMPISFLHVSARRAKHALAFLSFFSSFLHMFATIIRNALVSSSASLSSTSGTWWRSWAACWRRCL